MKSAVYCEHANESPLYERCDGKLVCRCPEDCYCKHEGGCQNLKRPLYEFSHPQIGHALYVEDRTVITGARMVASCTSAESLAAAKRLLSP